jgi:hypothetical protein
MLNVRRPKDLSENLIFWVVICTLGAIVVGALCWQLKGPWDRRIMMGNIRAHQEARVIGMLQNLAWSTKQAVRESGKEPPAQIHLLVQYLQEHCPMCLEVAAGANRDLETGALLDQWGTPIKLIVQSATDYTFMSCGPNRADEGGAGDDIVYTFNPMKLEEDTARQPSRPD